MANIAGSPAGQQIGRHHAASRLPLNHDMGLIGFLLARCAPTSVDLLLPPAFARRPLQWLT